MRFILALMPLYFSTAAAAQPDRSHYESGAIIRAVYGPEDTTSRLISIKIYTYRGDDGRAYNRYGVFDISDVWDIYGQTFSLGDPPQRRIIKLDDRTANHRNYVFEVRGAPGAGVFLGRPGNEEQISTSLDQLLGLRGRYVAERGTRVLLGGREFLIVPQGGSYPGFVFFVGDLAQRISQGDTACLYPEFFVQTMKKNSSGYWVQDSGPLLIGEVDGRRYEMIFNRESKTWEVRASP